MAINLIKGEKINLAKDNPGLQNIRVGLSWDVKLNLTADLDAAVLILGENDKLLNDNSLVYYSNLKSEDQAVEHKGDNRDGSGDGDDETVLIDLSKVTTKAKSVLIILSSYAGENDQPVIFGRVQNATARIYDDKKGTTLYEFDLSEDMSNATSMEMVKFYRHNNEWKMASVGEKIGTSKVGLEDVLKKYN